MRWPEQPARTGDAAMERLRAPTRVQTPHGFGQRRRQTAFRSALADRSGRGLLCCVAEPYHAAPSRAMGPCCWDGTPCGRKWPDAHRRGARPSAKWANGKGRLTHGRGLRPPVASGSGLWSLAAAWKPEGKRPRGCASWPAAVFFAGGNVRRPRASAIRHPSSVLDRAGADSSP